MLRVFNIIPSNADKLELSTETKDEYDGVIIHCLVNSDEETEKTASHALQLTDSSTIIVIGRESEELNEAAIDMAALDWVKKNTPSLCGDRVARQELSERRLEAETAFRVEWDRIFEPGRPTFKCYWKGNETLD